MNKYTIYCTEEQMRKALKLGAPIEIKYGSDRYNPSSDELRCLVNYDHMWYNKPTAEQMIGWLEGQGIWIHFCKPNQRPTLLSYSVSNISKPCRRVFVGREYESRKEATIAAIDDALEYLTNKK